MTRLYTLFWRTAGISLILLIIISTASCKSHGPHQEKDIDKKDAVVRIKDNKTPNNRIVDEALTWMDTPYGYAMSEKGQGTDCSGMVMRVYLDIAGIKLPRNSAKQAEFCQRLKVDDVVAGDLVFFATGKDTERISHVGIMLDDVNFIHASTSKGVVISKVNSPYYTRTFKMYGRVPRDDRRL